MALKQTGARIALAIAVLTAFAAAGCSSSSELTGGCGKDEDCGDPQLFRCDIETGACFCRADGACRAGEICNAQGYCQAHIGCYDNADCPEGYFCDAATNTCLAKGRCASDQHCPLGELCDKASSTCKPGCRSDGDCSLRETCLCATTDANGAPIEAPCGCTATTAAERANCPIGVCTAGTCSSDAFCDYAEVCREPADGGLKQCVSDYDPVTKPYCDACVDVPGTDTCGKGPNFCLYSTYTSSTYCGVDCSAGQPCPNGYDCADVIVVWSRTKCSQPSDCAQPGMRSNIQCTKDEDCPNHGLCGIDPGMTTGYCYGRCTFHEGANESFCSCVADEDCAQDSCNPSTRTCDITELPCDLAGNGCRRIRCVDFGNKGGCLIGQNCKPLEGLTCGDLRR